MTYGNHPPKIQWKFEKNITCDNVIQINFPIIKKNIVFFYFFSSVEELYILPFSLCPSLPLSHTTDFWNLLWNASISLYLCQFNPDLYATLNLSSCATNLYPQIVYLQCLEGVILFIFLYLCQFNLDPYETFNLSFCATNQ